MDERFVKDRITQLRIEKGISEREMSLGLGRSPSYINSISSGRVTPSLKEFFFICEYLNVSPSEFFQEDNDYSVTQRKLLADCARITEKITQLSNDFEVAFEKYRHIKT